VQQDRRTPCTYTDYSHVRSRTVLSTFGDGSLDSWSAGVVTPQRLAEVVSFFG
jgi:hypothetical protein